MTKAYQDWAIQKEMLFLEILSDTLELFPFYIFSHKKYFPNNVFEKWNVTLKIATDLPTLV